MVVMDVGAANTVAGIAGRGVVLREPAAIMLQAQTKRILATGNDAWNALERTPENIVALRPLSRGIGGCDPDVLAGMLRYQLTNVCRQNFFLCQPGVLFAVPSCTTAYERQMLADASYIGSLPGLKAGCVKRRVALVDETLAHAVGMGLWRRKGYSAALVVGARCCQAAIFADGELALSRCVHSRTPILGAGGDALDAAVAEFFARECGLIVGTEYAERIKRSVGASAATAVDVVSPPGCKLSAAQVAEGTRAAMSAPLARLVAMFGELLEDAARELGDAAVSEIASCGVMLSGGGAQLKGLRAMLGDKFKMEFALAERPLDSAAEGMLEMVASGRIPALPVKEGAK
jgi:rod shape-determining protein MreB